jgi:integrase/recombinase XerD
MEAEVQAFLSNLASQPVYSESTRLAYRNDLLGFITHLKENLHRSPTLADFDADNVVAYIDAERTQGRRLSTLSRRWATLKHFEKFLTQSGLLSSRPLSTNHRPIEIAIAAGAPQEPVQILTLEQVQRIVATFTESLRPADWRDQAIFTTLLETGLLVSGLVSLNLSDLDLRAGRIHTTFADEEDYWLPLGKAVEPIEQYLREGRPELNHPLGEPALFISQIGTRMTRQGIWQVLRHRGRQAHLPFVLSPRVVRHAAVLRMANSSRSLFDIQILLGHRNPLSTQALLRRLEAASLVHP